jgi:hypothetical protein
MKNFGAILMVLAAAASSVAAMPAPVADTHGVQARAPMFYGSLSTKSSIAPQKSNKVKILKPSKYVSPIARRRARKMEMAALLETEQP